MFIIDGIKAIFKLLIAFIIFIGSIACWLVDLVFNFSGRDIEGTDADYVESYYIIAKDVDNDKIRYYEVNGKGNKRNTDEFESDKFDEVVNLNECFQSYIDRDKNKVLNKYLDNCYMINQNGKDLSSESIYQDIAIQLSLLEHDMFNIKIYKIGNEYYVTRGLNVNIIIPYDLFKYDIENKKLIRICQTSDEEIIGFKKKNIYDKYDYDVKNAKSIILDDSIEVNGKKLDDKIRLVVYPTKNSNCKDDIKLYSQYENSNVYFVCIGEIEIIFNPNMSYVETINYNSKSNIDYIIRQMNIKEQYRDGGSIMYERESLRILKCNTVDGNQDIYIGYDNLEYKDGYCMNANLEKNKESKKTKNDNKSTYDELKAEFIGYANQFIIRSTYVFENNKAIACYMEIESDNELFLKPFPEDLSYLYDPLVKNVRYEGNKKYYEWSDEYFEEKGKGCSKAEIEDFLRDLGYTIIN